MTDSYPPNFLAPLVWLHSPSAVEGQGSRNSEAIACDRG